MRVVYINPNSTEAMTESLVAVARRANPEIEILGWTNRDGPPAIQGADDGAAALPGLIAMLPEARRAGADAIVIACFDDTGLEEARAAAPCPVIGIGQAAYLAASLLGHRFSVVTTLDVSVPVIEANIARSGHGANCVSVRASGLPVLTVEEGSEATRARLAQEIAAARRIDGATAAVLGCAGMAALRDDLAARTGAAVIDGVAASAQFAPALARLAGTGRAPSDRPRDEHDILSQARQTVERYLERSMVPDPEGAARYVSEDLRIVFTGGRRFTSPAETAGFNAKRYKWVRKRFLRSDATLDRATGEVRVFNVGYLFGEWPDGTPFETNRYIDTFVVRDGKIVETHVWNDSAEILLSRHGIAEAPL